MKVIILRIHEYKDSGNMTRYEKLVSILQKCKCMCVARKRMLFIDIINLN